MRGAVGIEHVAEGSQAGIWISKVMQHPGADDVLEGLLEFLGALDGELPHDEIVESVLAFQVARKRDALLADVDSDDPGSRPAQRVVRGLHRAASGDQNAAVVPVGLLGPKQVRLGAPAPIVPGATVRRQIVDRRRIRMPLIEFSNGRVVTHVRRAFSVDGAKTPSASS